jgi:hypothetical protein
MNVSYDAFIGAFLSKISEFELLQLAYEDRTDVVDGYLHRAVSAFRKNCLYPLGGSFDDTNREFSVEIDGEDVDELVDIVSEGMVVQWLKPYVYQQENLQNALNTRDFTTYSPAELLKRVGDTYKKAQDDFTQMIREYSYNHGDLTKLHT